MIRVGGHEELQAVVLTLQQLPSALRRAIFKATRENIVPEWREQLARRSSTSLEQRVIAEGARADVTATRGVTLKAAQSKRPMSGGGSPVQIGHAVECGAPWRSAEVAARRGATRYSYRRVVNKQLRPRRSAGWVAWPTATEFAPRFASLWTQVTVLLTHRAVEGKDLS